MTQKFFFVRVRFKPIVIPALSCIKHICGDKVEAGFHPVQGFLYTFNIYERKREREREREKRERERKKVSFLLWSLHWYC